MIHSDNDSVCCVLAWICEWVLYRLVLSVPLGVYMTCLCAVCQLRSVCVDAFSGFLCDVCVCVMYALSVHFFHVCVHQLSPKTS